MNYELKSARYLARDVLERAVCPGDTLAAYYENMLNICHKLNQMGVLPQSTGNCGVRSGKQKVTSQRHREGLVRSMCGNP